MDDLTLVDVHDDGEHVLLTAPDGRRFRLRVDDALRAAVRRDRARLGQLQIEMDGKLRPRDIQARVRAGHTAEEIADESRVPLAYVRRYEGPVLAEREYVAIQARSAVVRRGQGGEPTTLGQVVVDRLTRRGVEPGAVRWDAWRSDDGSWVVAADYPGADSRPRARWIFDQANRHVTALDDAARLLSGDDEQQPVTTGPRRLAPVQGIEIEAPSAWLDLPEPVPATAGSPVDLLDTLRERRGRRARPLVGDEDDQPGTDPVREAIDSLLEKSDAGSNRGAGRQPNQPDSNRRPGGRPTRPKQAKQASQPTRPNQPKPPNGSGRDLVEELAPEPVPDLLVIPEPDDEDGGHEQSAPGRKRGRASVPSWDDIVFGSRRD